MMRPSRDRRFPAVCLIAVCGGAVVGDCATSSPHAEYSSGVWGTTFFKPQGTRVEGVGLINENTAFFATRKNVMTLNTDGLLVEAFRLNKQDGGDQPENAEITAFHLCHHRNSILYEVQNEGGLSLHEYSLSGKRRSPVGPQFSEAPASGLACVDKFLLRTSAETLRAANLEEAAGMKILRRYEGSGEDSDALTSLAVGHAADVYTHAKIFAVLPQNRSLLQFHLTEDLQLISETLLNGGGGEDGPLASASAHDPRQILWSFGEIIFVDGCALRRISDGRVTTLLGVSTECLEPGNETLEPVPWATRLSRPKALASAAASTATQAALVLTGAEVIEIIQQVGVGGCSQHASEDQCVAQGCGWAEGAAPNQRLCFDCAGLERWADHQRPKYEACQLETARRAGTRYSLAGCGCGPLPPPQPTPDPDEDEEATAAEMQTFLAVIVVFAALTIAFLLYRNWRRAAVMRDLYGDDFAEFHVFTEDGTQDDS